MLLLLLVLSLLHRFPLRHCHVILPPSHHFPPSLHCFLPSCFSLSSHPSSSSSSRPSSLLFPPSSILLLFLSPPPLHRLSSWVRLATTGHSPLLGSPPHDVLSLSLLLSSLSSLFCCCQVLSCSNFVRWVNGGRMGENGPQQTSWPIFVTHHTGL